MLRYRLNDDDVSLLTIPQLEAFIFCQVLSGKNLTDFFILLLFLLCRCQRKVTNLCFTGAGQFFLSHHLWSLLWHLPVIAASLSLWLSYIHVELWKCMEPAQWSQGSEWPQRNLLRQVCWQMLVRTADVNLTLFCLLHVNMAQQVSFKLSVYWWW